jgi:hypothetical protein
VARLAEYSDQQILDAVPRYGSRRKAAAALGINPGSFSRKYKQIKSQMMKSPKGSGRSWAVETDGDEATVLSVDSDVRTVEDALAKAEIDTDTWMVDRSTVNSWEVASTDKDGNVTVCPLWQVKVWLKRASPLPIEKIIADLIGDAKSQAPRFGGVRRKKPTKRGYLVEISVPDLHVGKLCWADETGENYNTKAAVDVYGMAIAHFLERIGELRVSSILLPVGNDLLHVDNMVGTTTAGTKQDVDGRWQKQFRVARQMLTDSIEQMAEIAPVDVVRVPGNHDTENSFYLCEVLDAWFHNHKNVSVENVPGTRAYRRFGNTLIGFTHGHRIRHDRLVQVMIEERPEDYGQARHREFHLGHFHKKREVQYVAGDTHGGMVVRVLPSLSGTDAWHHAEGWVKGPKAAKAFVYDYEDGPVEEYTFHAPEGVYQ